MNNEHIGDVVRSYQDTDFEIRSVNFESMDEIAKIASIHEEMPLQWSPDYVASEKDRKDLIDKIISHSDSTDHIYLTALNSQNEIVAIEWGEIKTIHDKRAAYISSFWVDEIYRGSNIARKVHRKLEEWARESETKFISIDVHYNNNRMIKLAQLFGFKTHFVEMIKEFEVGE